MAKIIVWRSMLYVPSNNEKFLQKVNQRGADAIILDLEDSIPLDQKSTARLGLASIVERLMNQKADILVRINRPLVHAIPDLIAATIEGVDALMLPKIDSSEHLQLLEEVVVEQEIKNGLKVGSIKFVPMIETASGFFNMHQIAAASRRNAGITLGGEDFALDTGMVPDSETLFMASQKLVYAARAARIIPLGTIGTVADFKDLIAYRESAEKSQKFGFEGAACIHPGVVNILNEEFSPKDHEVVAAKKIIIAYEQALEEGRGAITVDGKMVDIPVVKRAKNLFERYNLIKDRDSNNF
jgi:citrate lyase subunit beta/citryl-CoA lyase